MFTNSRLVLGVPESPIEQHAFRSRSFRRILATACCSFLFVFTLHSLALNDLVQRQAAQESAKLQDKLGLGWFPLPRHSKDIQIPVRPSAYGQANTPEEIEDLPETIRIPFEEAVSDVYLQGWEDEWISSGKFDADGYGPLPEPKLDFVYNWVNGSDSAFKDIKHKYELASPLNDDQGQWISQHSINRYRDWDELKHSFRSLDKFANNFTNKIQLLVNSVESNTSTGVLIPQRPNWLKDDESIRGNVEILAQEDFYGLREKQCLPTFDSLSMESQIHATKSNVDQLVALSDDMFLGRPHSAADFWSPLFGSMIGFKQDRYNVKSVTQDEMPTFGEKPFLFYTSWLLNHRFGERERKAQAHFTHSISRRVMQEAMASFPSPSARGACERFRGESKYQIYPWYATYHYAIERFREALLWSWVMTRADANGDGYLDWTERQDMLAAIRPGRRQFSGGDASTPVRAAEGRDRMYYQLSTIHKQAGLQPPLSQADILWTSLDGPETIKSVKCNGFFIDKCFAESFDSPISDRSYRNPDFSAANIFLQLSKNQPRCGDCVIKFMLSTTPRGLEPLLPPKTQSQKRDMVVKALVKYQHTVIAPDAMFVMVTDAEQARNDLLERTVRRKKAIGQWCLNDDVMTEDADAVHKVKVVIQKFFTTLFPQKGPWEI